MVVARYRLNVDYTSATKGDDDGHAVFTPNVNITGGSGLSTNATIVAPLGTQAIAAAVAVTPATSSSWAVTGTFWQATQPVSGTVTATGPMTTAEYLANNRAATGTLSSVASGTGSVTILASNAARKGAVITNTDANVLYLDLSGGTASSTSFSVPIAANGVYELPNSPIYTGLITGIWAADGTGSALITQFT